MGMVFCRGCGKEIHEEAPMCPHCGAPQTIASQVSTGGLWLFGAIWTTAIWFIALLVTGFVMGLVGEGESAEAAGGAMAGPYFLISMIIAGILTYYRKLPGTRK